MNYRLRFVILKTDAIKSERVAVKDHATKKPYFIYLVGNEKRFDYVICDYTVLS